MTLFVDMDEVIADTYMAHIDLYNHDFGEQLTLEQCYGKDVWQCVPVERQKSVRMHATRDGFFSMLNPIEGSQQIMEQLVKRYDLFIASAAMQYPNSLKEKSDWLDEFFPFISWKNRILCGDKHILKGDILIDDRSYNLNKFKGRSILFTSPHNVHSNGFERVNSWKEVAEMLI